MTCPCTEALQLMLTTIAVRKVRFPAEIMPTYREAIRRSGSTVVIEALE